MCGFAGLMDAGASDVELRSVISDMIATLSHRGPDAEGFFIDKGIALGHRRLSILDLSPSGAQPMTLRNGPTIAFNGEIYNFRQLREELRVRGRTFVGHSDTEVALVAYDEWGLEGLKRLEGIFALAVRDPRSDRLILMRDRLGIKPLFYTRNDKRLAFGSEIKAVLAAGGLDLSLDLQALSEYLWFGNSYEDRTIYASVRSLLPGHWLILENGLERLEAWWQIEDWLGVAGAPRSKTEAIEAVRGALDAAVGRQLVADVPVGIFLSGGIDSSAIAASAMRVNGEPLHSYSVAFDFARGINELPKARQVANHLGLIHHEIHIRGDDLEADLLSLARSHDEPFADAANLPLFLLARKVAGTIKVVLQGDGGDELFAGYRRYNLLHRAAFWCKWPGMLTPMVAFAFGDAGRRFARMANALGAADPAIRMAMLLTTETLASPPTRLLGKDAREVMAKQTDPFLAYRKCAERFAGFDPVQQMLLTDLCLELPSRFLPKVDRATMAMGIEARVPLLDETIAKLAVNIPSRWKVNGSQKKIVLREALRGRIPDSILDAPKTGFGVPYEYWLKNQMFNHARDRVLDPSFSMRFGFERQRLEEAFSEFRNGSRNWGATLWKLFQMALWEQSCKVALAGRG